MSTKLFPTSDVFIKGKPLDHGFYDLELPDSFRWIKAEARCLLACEAITRAASPFLVVIANTHSEMIKPFLSIYADGKPLGTQQICSYGSYYFPFDAVELPGAESIEIVLKVDRTYEAPNDCRSLGIIIHTIQVIDLAGGWDAFEERRYLANQVRILQSDFCLSSILNDLDIKMEGRILDLGAGMGWTTCLLAAKTKARVYGIDLRQYEDSQGISFKSELLSRLSRHRQILIEENLLEKSCPLEEIVNRCSFLNMDARELFFKDNFFDFAFSLNSFEHIADPAAAVAELSRTLKPTGEAFLHFQPMYFSDMGHHLFGLLELPWVHLLHDRATIKEMICEQGKVANEVDNILDSLNGYGLEDYMEVLSKTDLQVVDMRIHRGVIIAGADRSEQFIQLKQIYPEEELLATGITVHLRK